MNVSRSGGGRRPPAVARVLRVPLGGRPLLPGVRGAGHRGAHPGAPLPRALGSCSERRGPQTSPAPRSAPRAPVCRLHAGPCPVSSESQYSGPRCRAHLFEQRGRRESKGSIQAADFHLLGAGLGRVTRHPGDSFLSLGSPGHWQALNRPLCEGRGLALG